jgi:cytochrome c peroxidase
MNFPRSRVSALITFSILSACKPIGSQAVTNKEALGELFFHDSSLSRDGAQSCANCHDSKHAFIDPGVNITSVDTYTPGAVSVGQDGESLGDINTPSAAYAAFIPEFYFDDTEKLYMAGLFLDGRARHLEEQAKHPFLNPVEMQTSKAAVVAKVQTKYKSSMQALFGEGIFDDTESAFTAITEAIATFERSEIFASFDSKFDRVLKAEAEFTESEQRGLDLFKAEEKGDCAACHPVPKIDSSKEESLFTDFSYDNLGVPKNSAVRAKNGKPADYVDTGLFNNPEVNDPELKGAFRVTSLRNVAVTAPYMHNGVFKELKTVIHFYNSRDVNGAVNSETQSAWAPAEIDATKNEKELGQLGLTDEEEDAIISFLKTLTDKRYEHLIP